MLLPPERTRPQSSLSSDHGSPPDGEFKDQCFICPGCNVMLIIDGEEEEDDERDAVSRRSALIAAMRAAQQDKR